MVDIAPKRFVPFPRVVNCFDKFWLGLFTRAIRAANAVPIGLLFQSLGKCCLLWMPCFKYRQDQPTAANSVVLSGLLKKTVVGNKMHKTYHCWLMIV